MALSFVAMNRLVEEQAAKDEEYRRLLKRNHRRTLSDARALSDDELLQKLHSLGLKQADREWLDYFSRKVPSAQILANAVTGYSGLEVPVDEEDWVWFALVCLWERWFPDRPNFEMLDDQMQAGYQALEKDEVAEAVQLWGRVWSGVEQLMAAFEIASIEGFDEWFGGTNCIFNWVQDYSSALYRASRRDRTFAQQRVELCGKVIALEERPQTGQSLLLNFRRDLAESHADLGEYEVVDRLYREWLGEDPRWGWGWIGWSDCYRFTQSPRQDLARTEQILKEGLEVAGVEDREYIVERLADMYEQSGRTDEAGHLRKQLEGDESNETSQTDVAGEWSIDEIISELDREYDGTLPEAALRAAQRRREEITPRLIELIRGATEQLRAGHEVKGNGHFFALLLLTEFEAKAALPAILAGMSLPGEGPFDLFGDAVHEVLSRLLARLPDDPPQLLRQIIADRSVNEYVRWAAVETYRYLVRDGLMTRDDAVQRLREHLCDANMGRDREMASALVDALCEFASPKARDEIDEAYRRGLVDEDIVSPEEVARTFAEGDQAFQRWMSRCPPSGIPDAVEELRDWGSFQPPEEGPWGDGSAATTIASQTYDSAWEDEFPCEGETPYGDRAVTIYRETPRIGRNDPCPCGSGKKYKKCCGKNG